MQIKKEKASKGSKRPCAILRALAEAPTGDTFYYKFTKFILHRRDATGPCESPVGASRLCDARVCSICMRRFQYNNDL